MKSTRLKNLFLISLIMLCCANGHAQDFWETLDYPDSVHIRCITINSDNHIFIGTGGNWATGGVYISHDGGITWELSLYLDDFSVNEIAIHEDGRIYIGRSGFDRLMVSNDNGDTWIPLSIPSSGGITSILPIGLDTIFVGSGEANGALLLRSIDNGNSWDTVFFSENFSEYVTDIIVSETGTMYIGLKAYFTNMAGVYESEDNGNTWTLSGLFNYMISSLSMNSTGDIFAGIHGTLQSGYESGLFVLRKGEEEWGQLLAGPSVQDVIVNSDNHIYISCMGGVIRSLDNGISFEYINEGLPQGQMKELAIDNSNYLFVTNVVTIARSINPTVSVSENIYFSSLSPLAIYPNPSKEHLFIKNISGTDRHYSIRVYNELGILVLQTEKERNFDHAKLNVGLLNSGIYFIEIFTDKTKKSGRFIKY